MNKETKNYLIARIEYLEEHIEFRKSFIEDTSFKKTDNFVKQNAIKDLQISLIVINDLKQILKSSRPSLKERWDEFLKGSK